MNILCVDDEIPQLMMLVEAAVKTLPEAEVFYYLKAKEALECARETEIDVAFLDIELGPYDGLSLAEDLLQIHPKCNIVFCTGYSDYALSALDIYASGYLLKPITQAKLRVAIEHLRYPVWQEQSDKASEVEKSRLVLICFGNFSAYVDGKPLRLKYKKSMEMLAYLTDRRGAMCSTAELSAVLFEDDTHTAYLSKLRSDLISSLDKYGLSSVLILRKGGMAIDCDKVSCDYYDYLDGKQSVKFLGEYMSQYSFGETTLGYLLRSQQFT